MKYLLAALLFAFFVVILSAPVWLAKSGRCGGATDPFNPCGVVKK